MRMLGSGRPFVLEVANARAAMPDVAYFQAVQDALNAVWTCYPTCCLGP